MAAKVAQIACAIFVNDIMDGFLLLKLVILDNGRALWAAHVHQISVL